MADILSEETMTSLETCVSGYVGSGSYNAEAEMTCGCTGDCGQSCAGGCESGCSGDCGRSCAGACS